MSDVFISYARSTEPHASMIAETLSGLGYAVWRDDALPAHRAYSDVIEEQLRAANAVVVLWSAEAAASEWVRSEANFAREQRKLVQLRLDDARLPMPFDQIQCADLRGWAGAPDHPGWRKAVESIATLAGVGQAAAGAMPRPQPAAQAPRVATDNLPKRLPSLVGREADVARIVALLAQADLVTLAGAGGVGKTRLAVEAAERLVGQFPEGAWLVELAPVADPAQVPGAVARAMGVALSVGENPLEAVVERISLRECLIVLDNCEHVIDAAAAFARAVLARSRGVKLLASSQEPLEVDGEQVFRLRSLDAGDAAALFAERARAADASFSLQSRDEAVVADICRRLDGIPLAIEMAAARAPALGCDGVLQRLGDRFRLLTGGRRTALPRQRTLAATLDWSHGLLSEVDAIVFRRLAVFSGGFTLEAASNVASDERLDALDVVDAVASLSAKSLVTAEAGVEGPRHRLLETTRAYALDKLDAAGELPAIQRRHAQWALQYFQRCGPDYSSHMDDAAFAARYFGEHDNLERAMDWALGPTGDIGLAVALLAYGLAAWAAQSLYPDYLRWLDLAAPRLDEVAAGEVRARFLTSRLAALMLNMPAKAVELADEAIAAARILQEPAQLAATLNSAGFALYAAGRWSEAAPYVEESLQIVRKLPTGRTPSQTKQLAGVIRLQQDGLAAAEPLLREALSDLRAFGANGLANFFEAGQLSARSISPAEAAPAWRALLALTRPDEMLSGFTLSLAVGGLLHALAELGDPRGFEEALAVYRTHYRRIPTAHARGWVSAAIASVLAQQGRLREAALLLGYAEAFAGRTGVAWLVESHLGRLRQRLGEKLTEPELAEWSAQGGLLSEDDALKLPVTALGNG